ncbi:MAG: hypothetical protein ACI9GW_002634, partial [Halieaceae bacterium]
MRFKKMSISTVIAFVTLAICSASIAADRQAQYSPNLNKSYASNLYWGDTHLHTSLSTDAGAAGNRLGLDEAYIFASGGEVKSSRGHRARLSR